MKVYKSDYDDVKLSIALEVAKMKKEATLGHLGEVADVNDVRKVAKMVYDMVQLPKYQSIISELRGARGIVNFAHNNEYQPLIEAIVVAAFPPAHNDVYNTGEDTPSYFMSPGYFQSSKSVGSQGATTDASMAAYKLQNFIFGTPVRTTSKWMKEKGNFDDEDIAAILGGTLDEKIDAVAGGEGAHPGDVSGKIRMYEAAIDNIETKIGPLIETVKAEIEQHYNGKETLSTEVLKQKIEKRDYLLSMKKRALEMADAELGKELDLSKWSSGLQYRNQDGFIHFSPTEVALTLTRDFAMLKMNELADNEIGATIDRLQEVMLEIRSKNPKMQQIIAAILAFLGEQKGDVNPEEIKGKNAQEVSEIKLKNRVKRIRRRKNLDFISLQHAFSSVAKQQGRVLIFDDFDTSANCVTHGVGKDKTHILTNEASKVFHDFMGLNSAYLLQDITRNVDSLAEAPQTPVAPVPGEKKDETYDSKGNRIAVIISARPITDLPVNAIVELNVAPVDLEEAKIIIDNLMADFITEVKKIYRRNRRSEIAAEGKIQPKNIAQAITREMYVQKFEENIAPEQFIAHMQRMIIGLGQQKAIDTVAKVLRAGTQVEYATNGVAKSMTLNHKSVLENARVEVNKVLSRDIPGLSHVQSEVPMNKYAYKKISDWGDAVLGLKNTIIELEVIKEDMASYDERIARINRGIEKYPEDVQEALIGRRDKLIEERNTLKISRMALGRNVPHMYLLYGEPGVGKSIWAHAMADLFQIEITDVDFGANLSKWLGESNQNFINLMNTMKNQRDTVFLIDEIDRQVEMGKGGGEQTHGVVKDLVHRLLKFFDNSVNEQLFKEHNTFFVLTSNYLNNIDAALRDRFETQFEVELPDDPKDYEMFFKSFMDVEKTRFPNEPIASGKNIEEAWENTFKLINSLDWTRISESFCGGSKQPVNFRKLKQILRRVFSGYLDYQTTVDLLNKGYDIKTIPSLRGLPLTTDNIMNLPEYMGRESEGEGQFKLGVSKYERELWAKVEPILEKYKNQPLPQEEYTDPVTGKIKMRSVFPKEANDILSGATFRPVDAEEIEVTRDIDPATGRVKTKFAPPKSPAQQMEDLKGEGFEEESLDDKVEPKVDVVEEKQPDNKKKDKGKKEEKVASTTDYFFKYLQDKGVISDDGKTVVGKSDVNKEELQKESQVKGKEKYKPGVYNFGFLMFAPAYPGVKPQNINYTDASTVNGLKGKK